MSIGNILIMWGCLLLAGAIFVCPVRETKAYFTLCKWVTLMCLFWYSAPFISEYLFRSG